MNILNQVVDYWYDCIKNEDILEKDISIQVRSKAVLYPFDQDHFIFNRQDYPVLVSNNEKLITFSDYIDTNGWEAFYGYPILFYFDNDSQKHLVAPLFIIKVQFVKENGEWYLHKDEPNPTCGIQALSRIGLRTEEIADLSREIEGLYRNESYNNKDLSEKCLSTIQKEVEINLIEEIIPNQLTNSERLSRNASPGLYNKSLVFAGENTLYNLYLLTDLLDLRKKRDLDKTALSFILEEIPVVRGSEKIPVLPFPSNEYQVRALQDIYESKLTVITGPPGTGKSQYISNLLVNLFLEGKKVLLVSHTNAAVEVVHERLNEQFKNLMFRTGKKEFRQELKGKFNELILDSEKRISSATTMREITSLWKMMNRCRDRLLELGSLEKQFEEIYSIYKTEKDLVVEKGLFSELFFTVRNILTFIKLRWLRRKLNKFPARLNIEQKIRNLEKRFYGLSEQYVKSVYIKQMLGRGKNIGRVKSFLHEVDSIKFNEDIEHYSFENALNILSVWSSTLKSIRRTFPLSPGIFDYVIFDEASQVDLPSAAPALYRAKRAIVVGDPMQLSHIAGITRDIDKSLAKIHGLTESKDLYPHKVRYCDVSLYKSAENSLVHKPILLTNHYRSEDQIIALCNQTFYEGRLKIMTTLDYSQYPRDLHLGIYWKKCAGEVFKPPGGSRINQIEINVVNEKFQSILKKILKTNLTIGIVTPYSRQQNAIAEKIIASTPNYSEMKDKHNIEVLTAHKFQGTEKDIMIFSLVLANRGNGNSDRWYNIYPQILNVALSRARYLLYVVGDRDFCLDHSCYREENCILKKLVQAYDKIKKQEELEEYTLHEKFDTFTERFLYEKLKDIDFKSSGYELRPKQVVKRYTLDIALLGKKKIDVECDGGQHEIIEGMPVLEDLERDEFLKRNSWIVLRFPNHKILSDTNKVIEIILEAL